MFSAPSNKTNQIPAIYTAGTDIKVEAFFLAPFELSTGRSFANSNEFGDPLPFTFPIPVKKEIRNLKGYDYVCHRLCHLGDGSDLVHYIPFAEAVPLSRLLAPDTNHKETNISMDTIIEIRAH